MATARHTLVMAGKASAGRGGDGHHGRTTLRAKVALGLATLGCAATLAFGGLQARDAGRTQGQSVGMVATGAWQGADQVEMLAQYQFARTTAPGEDAAADQVAWLEGFQVVGQAGRSERHETDQVTWLERFQSVR